MQPFTMYHKEYAPGGQDFDLEDGHTPVSLSKEGWVDNPAKLGINLWGPDAQAHVDEMAAKFEQRLIPAVDGPDGQLSDAEEKQRQLDEKDRQIHELEAERDRALRGEEDAHTKRVQAEKDAADMQAEADRLKAGELRPEAQSQVPPSLDDRIEMAINFLEGNAEAFGKDGRPLVEAIEKVLRTEITAADRDRVWNAMQDKRRAAEAAS